MPKNTNLRIMEMYQKGHSIRKICETLHVSTSTVQYWVKKLGARRKPRRVKDPLRAVTFNITEDNWNELAKHPFRSVYINEALAFYAQKRKKNDGQLTLDF